MTHKQVDKMFDKLVEYGKQRFKPEYRDTISRGKAIGFALYAHNDGNVCVDVAIESLEQWNGHLSVACIDAIEKQTGKVTRKGNIVTIELPDYWNKI